MEFVGDHRFSVSAMEVWLALNDTEVLKRTIPGCEVMEQISPTQYAGHLKINLGLLTAAFDGRIALSELNPPTSYRIAVEAHGAIAGSATGSARVRLKDVEGGSILHYEAETEIGGRLAKLGVKLMHGTAIRYAEKFFARFTKAMEERRAEFERLPG
jgi:carbon monoxide dehydrogenase subunit G